jgi:1-acyl-sn-glycerol-3-phosphate acyltransferase
MLGAQQRLAVRVVCNTTVEYRGSEKIPEGPLIVASKHQSMWETFALLQFFDAAAVHPQARAEVDPVFRLVSDQDRDDRVDRGAGASR